MNCSFVMIIEQSAFCTIAMTEMAAGNEGWLTLICFSCRFRVLGIIDKTHATVNSFILSVQFQAISLSDSETVINIGEKK